MVKLEIGIKFSITFSALLHAKTMLEKGDISSIYI